MKCRCLISPAFAAILFANLFIGIAQAEPAFVEGQHYEQIVPAVSTQSGDKIEVVEIFWYGCGHCFDFEPFLEKWIADKPEDLTFLRIPGVFGRAWVPHGRAFYAVQSLGALEQFHRPLFDAIHLHKRGLKDAESLTNFAVEQGIEHTAFTEAYKSFDVDTKVRKALAAAHDYGITGVPSVIINGKYRTSARLAGTYEKLLKIIDFLVDKERNNP